MGRWMLGTHVDHHALLLFDFVVEDVVVGDEPAELVGQSIFGLVGTELLGALVGGLEAGLLGAGHPDVERVCRGVCGRPSPTVRNRLLVNHQSTWWDALNWTGTSPTPKSLRRGCPSQSSGIRIRVRSGWPSKVIPNMS
jgi:hypothetical protein